MVKPKEDNSLTTFLRSKNNSSNEQIVPEEPLVEVGVGQCKEHGRPLELICVDDKKRVCA